MLIRKKYDVSNIVFRKLYIFITALFMVSIIMSFCVYANAEINIESNEENSAVVSENQKDYYAYHENNNQINNDANTLTLNADKALSVSSADYRVDYQGDKGKSIALKANDEISWEFSSEADGIFALEFHYYPIEGDGNPIVQKVLINDKVPFIEAENITLSRIWANETNEPKYDLQGNQLLVKQVEKPKWIKQYAEDLTGLAGEPFYFSLTKGKNKITLQSVREPILLKSISLIPYNQVVSDNYNDVLSQYKDENYSLISNDVEIHIDAENASSKSDQSIIPLVDRTSPTVDPYSSSKLLYNTIGGKQWTNAGQWIEWDFTVGKTGLYALSMHFKQALKEGRSSVREIYIDDKMFYKELSNIQFSYSNTWQTDFIKDENNNPFLFYLEAGSHKIKLKVGLGEYNASLKIARDYLNTLNEIYREIVVITGTSPDMYRDYNFEKMIPETIIKMEQISEKLKKLEKSFNEMDNSNGKNIADIKRIYTQLDMMVSDTDTISQRLTTFKDTVASYGTWINSIMGQPLEIDWLKFSSPEKKLPKGESNFLGLAAHYIKQLMASYSMDYSQVGQTENKSEEKIRVWMTSGRDQAEILKRIVNSDFTPDSGIAVDMQLVSQKALLPAVLAGIGPDVTLGLAQADPLNLALRNGLLDLSEFKDFSEVKERFYDYAIEPFKYREGVYALPETQSYPMLFYRKDILNQLNISTKELTTWDSILSTVLPKLQKSSLTFGLLPSVQNYLAFSSQQGGSLYIEDGKMSGLGSSAAIKSMKQFTMLYSQYDLPLSFDFANRFRTGEMPIAVTDFTQYNLLTIFAPEIKGLWGMLPMPGTEDEQGINNTAVATFTSCAILSLTEKPQQCWDFLSWWTSADTQASFGKSLESLVGPAARYNTANKEAMTRVQWDSDIFTNLMFQAENLIAYNEVPGGYFTARLFDFSFRSITNEQADVRERMNKMVADINRELKNKREEYGVE